MSEIRVFAPATVANVACGFDVLGFAVDAPGDEVVARLRQGPGVVIATITGDNGKLPKEAEKNTAGLPVIKFLKSIGSSQGIELELHKKMPLGSGMGSSAASAVAALVAVNELLSKPLKREDLLPFAMEGERLACGATHADNVAPSLYGGLVLIRSYEPLDVIRIPSPPLFCTLIHPDVEVNTSDARSILKKDIPLKKAIAQWGNVAGLVAGLMKSDYGLISRSLQDVIVEPVRSMLIPGFDAVKKAALEAGALGGSISGSGPSIFALSQTKEIAERVALAMQKPFQELGLASEVYISAINQEGPKIL